MSSGKLTIKRRVWVGLVVAAAGILTWSWWVRSRQPMSTGPGRGARPFVQLASAGTATGNRILQERAELMDPTPLFFPTEWNYGQRPLNAGRAQQPSQVFGSFDPKLTFNDQTLAPYGAEALQAPGSPIELLAQGNEAPFAGLGQVEVRKTTLLARAGYLEVRKFGFSENSIDKALAEIQLPRSDITPVEFLVVIGNAGLIGDPMLVSGSGWEEVDVFLKHYLATSFHLGERLSPGRYRVLVGI